MVTPIRRWMAAWTRMREQRAYLGQRWAEPSNEITRAVLGDHTPPELPRGPLFEPSSYLLLRRRAPLRSFDAEVAASVVPPVRRRRPAATERGQRNARKRRGRAA